MSYFHQKLRVNHKMMKKIYITTLLIALLSLLGTKNLSAQSNTFIYASDGSGIPGITKSPLSNEEWKVLYRAVEAEDWKYLAKASKKALDKFTDENSVEKGLVRYMHLYAIAGLLAKGKITKELALEKAKQHIGKRVTVPPHVVCLNAGGNNCYSDEAGKLKIVLTNYKETFKHIVTTITPAEMVNLSNYGDKELYAFGMLQEIKIAAGTQLGFETFISGGQIFARGKK